MSYRYCVSCKFFDLSDNTCLKSYYILDVLNKCPDWQPTLNKEASLKCLEIRIEEMKDLEEFYRLQALKLIDISNAIKENIKE